MDSNFIQHLAVSLPGFLFAIVFHEAAHAWMATKFGDDTAKSQGRLSLNPVVHYDLVGTVIFPLIGALMGGVMFGWAKPVPIDTRRFRNVRSGIFWVSFTGPGANILLSLVSTLLMALVYAKVPQTFEFYEIILLMLKNSMFINIILAVFNLIPFPPLDGSKMVSSMLDYEAARKYEDLQRYSFVFILILWFTPIFSYLLRPAIYFGNQMFGLFLHLLG